jgi:hypothetical protein
MGLSRSASGARRGGTLADLGSRELSCPRYLAHLWQRKARAARRAYELWHFEQYAWREWLPGIWFRLAVCETGHNPPNWAHDSGTYVSGFGIYRPGYRDDSHRIGQLSWDETIRKLHRLPTPREQYEAALSHYREHGGFSGWGCRGA